MNKTAFILGAAALSLTIGSAYAAPAGIKAMTNVLVDAKGMTLYTFDADEAGTSNCYDACATNWPPLTAAAGASAEGDYSVVKRTDGTMQWALKGQPLYLWVNDNKPGDKTGDGIGGAWHVVPQ
jgi:predicted lipoprotein with Yx(FWY)xxD motif